MGRARAGKRRIKVRPSTWRDWLRIWRWRRNLVRESGQIGKAKFLKKHLIAERDGEPVGMIGISPEPRGMLYHREDARSTESNPRLGRAEGHVIGDLYVERAHRKGPVSRKLLTGIMEEAKRMGAGDLLAVPGHRGVHRRLQRLEDWERLGPSTVTVGPGELATGGGSLDVYFPELAPVYRKQLK